MKRWRRYWKRRAALRTINRQLKHYAGRHEGLEYLVIALPVSTKLLDEGNDGLVPQLAGEMAGKLAYESTKRRMHLVSPGGLRVPE